MAISYEDIIRANEGLDTIDLKGKSYVMVPQRVKAFRKLFPDGFINTEILSLENGVCVMKCEVGYFEADGNRRVMGTGTAFEVQGKGMVNGTSYIENCETSCVGRALGFLALGIDGGGICSAEELVNAIKTQEQIKAEKQNEKEAVNPPFKANDQMEVSDKLPANAQINPVANFIRNEISDIQEKVGLKTYAEAKKQVMDMASAMIEGKAINPFDWKTITMEEARNVFGAIRKMLPEGDVA